MIQERKKEEEDEGDPKSRLGMVCISLKRKYYVYLSFSYLLEPPCHPGN